MGGPPEDKLNWGIKPALKNSQIRDHSKALTFIEEAESTIDDGHFLYAPAIRNWLNVPSSSHQNGATLAFADGHAEYWRWKSAISGRTHFTDGAPLTEPSAIQDLERLQQTAANAD